MDTSKNVYIGSGVKTSECTNIITNCCSNSVFILNLDHKLCNRQATLLKYKITNTLKWLAENGH